MNIVFFVTGLDSGGIENYLLRFLQYKADSFSEVVVYCKGGKGGQLEEAFQNISNVQIIKNNISFFNFKDYIQLTRYFKIHHFDVVCDFTGNFAGLVLWSAERAGIKKRVVFYRGSTDHFDKTFLKSKYNNFVRRLTYKYATDILSNSKAAFDFFYKKEKQDSRFQVIYNGIDANKFNVGSQTLRKEFNIPENAFVIGHTGRFNYAKNHHTIIQVARVLIERYSDVYFILCGNGVKTGLEKKVQELGIKANIRLFDNRRDIPVFLNTMNAYFFPSVTEGQPNALIEAMIMGLPFVASDIEPVKETVVDHSKLFNPFDIDGFSTALEKLYLEKADRDLLLKEETIERFDYKERFDEFYKKLNEQNRERKI